MIIISGKMGVGKSSLINGLVGKEVAKEATSVTSVTSAITSYSFSMKIEDRSVQKTIEVTVLDTPGLGDPFGKEEDNLVAIAERCSSCDLLIYCLDMRGRFTKDDAKGIRELTSSIGSQVWKNTVFALTFANEVKPPPQSSTSRFWYYVSFGYYNGRLELFKRLLSEWKESICKALEGQNALTDELAIVPTGYRHSNPPDRKDWLAPFWFEAFRKTNKSSQPAFLGINLHRIRCHLSQGSDADKTSETSVVQEGIENHHQMLKVNLEKVTAVVQASTSSLEASIETPIIGLVVTPEEEDDWIWSSTR